MAVIRADEVADRLLFVGAAVAVVDRAEVVLELGECRAPVAQHSAGQHSADGVSGVERRRRSA